MATRMIRSRANWKKAWTEDEIYNQFVKDNPQHKAAAKDDVVKAYLEQRDASGAPLFEAFEKSDNPLEYMHRAASNLGPDAMRYLGDTISGIGKVAGGAVKVAAGLANPFQTPEARLQTLTSVAEGVKAVPDVAVAAKDYVRNRFAGTGAVLGAIDPVTAVVRPEAAAENRRLAAISPVLQNVRDTPVQMAGDVASVIDVAALPLRAAPVATAATLRSVGRNAPGRVGAVAQAASGAPVLSQINEAGQALSRVSNAVDPLTAPGVAAHAVAPGKMQDLKQAMAGSMYRRILNPPKSLPRTEINAMVEEGLHKRVPVSEAGLGDPGAPPLPPEYNSVTSLIQEADQMREARALDAAQSGNPALSHIDINAVAGNAKAPGVQGLRKLWDRYGNSDAAAAVRQKVWDEVDSALRSWTDGSLDPAGRPVPRKKGSADQEFNPDFDVAFKWEDQPHQIPVHSQGKPVPNAVDIRKEANATLADYRTRRAKEGAEAKLPEEESLSIILRDVINEPFFEKLDAVSGATGGDATKAMGRQESIHIKLRDAIDASVKSHEQSTLLQQPYYYTQGGIAVAGIFSGNFQAAATTVAALAALRAMYQHFPGAASKFAINLANKNPDPAFWRGVLNHVRMLDKANRQPPRPQESAPPVPPGVQAKPVGQGDFEDGPGDFK